MEYNIAVVVNNEGMKQYAKSFIIETDTIAEAKEKAIESMKQYISKNKKRKIDPTFWVSYIAIDGKIVEDYR